MEGGSQGSVLDQAAAQRLLSTGEKLQWQQVQEYDRQPTDVKKFGSETSHLTAVFTGWAVIVGGSVAKSVFDPSKRHLMLSHRLIHARIVAQWATVGALVAAGAAEKMVSMYGSAAPAAAAEGVRPSAVYEARQPPRKEDWTRL